MRDSDRFLLVGVGGAGGRMANQVAQATGGRLRAAALDTDFAAVAQLGLCQQFRFGRSRFDGGGSGGNATLAQMAAEEEADLLRKLFAEVQIAIVVAGLGGGTGSGMTPVALRVARDLNVRTLVIATLPCAFEGAERRALATRTCPPLDEAGDVVALFENDALCADAQNLPLAAALDQAGRTLSAGMTLLWRLASSPGYIGLDFATLASLLQIGRGRAWFACARAAGERRLEEAMAVLLDHPQRGIRRHLPMAPGLLVGILGGDDLRLKEVGDVMVRLKMETGPECDVRMGTVQDAAEAPALSIAALLFRSWHPGVSVEPSPAFAEETPLNAAAGLPVPQQVPRPVARTRRSKAAPGALGLAGNRFRNTHATLYNGEDLDVPTYLRRGLRIDVG